MMKTKQVVLPKRYWMAITRTLSADIATQVEVRYAAIYTESTPPENPILQRHFYDQILPGLALYQTLRQEYAQDETLKIIDRVFENAVIKERKNFQLLGRFPLIYPLLRLYVRTAMRKYPEDGWETEWLEVSNKAIRFNMHRCFYCDTLTRYGAPELTASFCRMDDVIYERMSPYVGWRRTQTIARGAKYCDFAFLNKSKSV